MLLLKKHSFILLTMILIIIKNLFLLPVTLVSHGAFGSLDSISLPKVETYHNVYVNLLHFKEYTSLRPDGDLYKFDLKQHMLECLVIILIVFILFLILKYIKTKKTKKAV